MKKFTVEVTETLQRQIEVKAADKNEAISIVEDMYRSEEVVLDSGDYIDTEFNLIDKNGERADVKSEPAPKTALEEKLLDWANSAIDQQCEIKGVREVIAELLRFGFTSDELINKMKFDANDVEEVLNDWDITEN